MGYSYSIVIVTYNRLNLLKECLEHAVNQTILPAKIIVVDNCSTDGTSEFLDKKYADHPLLMISHEKENTGGAGGFSRGVQLAAETQADWVLLIDDDAILDYTCMEKMDPNSTRIKASAYACRVICEGITDISHRRNLGSEIPVEQYDAGDFKCDLATFCGLMFERKLIEKIGFPISEYFIWYDDSEYCLRINELSPIVVRTEAFLIHKTTIEKDEMTPYDFSWKQYYGIRNSIHALRKHGRYSMLFKTIWQTVKQIRSCMTKEKAEPRYADKRKMYWDSMRDGIKGELGKNQNYLPGMRRKN